MLAATFNDASSENYWIAMDNFGDDNVQNGIWQGTELYERNPTYGSSLGSVMLSFLGRMEYKFRNRYILTANIRTDGSSKFSPPNTVGALSRLLPLHGLSATKSSSKKTFLGSVSSS